MDITKQYPNLSLDPENAAIFDIESVLSKLGLSVVDIINLSRACDRQTAEDLSARSGTSAEGILRLLLKAKQLFTTNLKPIQAPIKEGFISTNLSKLDESLLGGIPLGRVTEVFGASGCGKSQFLLSLAVKAQVYGKIGENACIYISTESPLESRRLSDFSTNVPGALDRISYVYCPDLEQQDHILFTQLRLKLQEDVSKGGIPRMVIIDSVGHHLRAEDSFLNTLSFFRSHLAWQEEQLLGVPLYRQEKVKYDSITNRYLKGDARFRNRTSRKYYLFTLYSHLADIARTFNVAVVLANQVSDVMDLADGNSNTSEGINGFENDDPLLFDHQVGTFLGWNVMSFMSQSILEGIERAPQSDARLEASLQTQSENRKRGNDDGSENENRWYDDSHTCSSPKKKVPAMGYAWSKLMTHRILLWKSYQPVFDEGNPENEYKPGSKLVKKFKPVNDENREQSENGKNHENRLEATRLAPCVSGFKIRRFARAVLCHALPGAASTEFEISQTGICEVHGTSDPV